MMTAMLICTKLFTLSGVHETLFARVFSLQVCSFAIQLKLKSCYKFDFRNRGLVVKLVIETSSRIGGRGGALPLVKAWRYLMHK